MNAPAAAISPPPYRILYASLLVVGAGNSMMQPLFPPLARQLGLPDSSLGWIFSLSALFWVFASPFWGRRSDDVGRKPIIALGMAAYSVSMGLFALVVVIGLFGWLRGLALFIGLILARAIFGAVGSATGPAAQAYVADRSTPLRRTERIAALTSAFAVGAAIGPGLGGLLAGHFGLVSPFVFTCVVAACTALLIWRLLPEPNKPVMRVEGSGWRESVRLAADDRLAPFLIYGLGLSTVAGTLQQTYTLYLMDRLNVRGEHAAQLASAGFIVGALALLATQIALIPLLRWKSRAYMTFGAALVCVGAVVQLLSANMPGLVASQFLQGIGFGLTRPGFAGGASMAVTPREQGAAAGLVVAVSGAGFVISPITGGVVYDYVHATAPLWISIALLIAMGAFAWRSRRLRHVEAAPLTGMDPS